MGLDREGENATRREHTRNGSDDRSEIVQIDKDIGGEDEVIRRLIRGFVGKASRDVGGNETIVKAFRRRLRDHRGRKVDADEPIDEGTKRGAAKSRAAAKVEHGAEAHRPLRRLHDGFDRQAQQRRPSILEMLGERSVVARGILVEQPADIRLRHRRRSLAGAEPCELQPGAVVVVGIGVARPLECGDRIAPVAQLVADGAEREPRRGKAGCKLDGLLEDFGGAGEIAARRMVERPFVTPVGDKVARGDKERAGVGHCVLAPQGEMIIYDLRCVLKISSR